MFAYYPQSQYQPCPDCGAPVAQDEEVAHRCERLRTPQGRFAQYYARRERDRVGIAA